MNYELLFTPGFIGTLQLQNRIIMGSMHLGYEGVPGGTERMAEFYAARARGGAALIITGGCAVNEEAIGGAQFSCIFREEDVNALKRVVECTHEAGGKIGLQLFHAGRYATREWLGGIQPVAPSPIRCTLHPATPREMSEQDIQRTIGDFGQAALKAKQAGFDCVEVMGSEGYLINQFFSPLTNKRADRWGGTLENRARFSVEVLTSIRKHCGADFPVIYRVSGLDLMPQSSTWEETLFWIATLQNNGADAFNIGIGWHESRIPTISMLVPRGHYSFVAERIKKVLKVPCIASNRINDPDTAEEILRAGKADFVSMARALLADPELPVKAQNHRAAFINNCIACNQACLDHAFRSEPTTCILNPEAGREKEMQLNPASHRKKVAVVGAGPAGLEASMVLAKRGHHVTLFERRDRIGGQLLHAVKIPGKQEFLNTIRYYSNNLKELGVQIELKASPGAEDLQNYDAVMVATGAIPNIPDIPGIKKPNCMDYEQFFNDSATAKDIAIVGAGGIGCDVAHLLSVDDSVYPPASFFDDVNNVAHYEDYLRAFPRKHHVSLIRRGKRIGEKLGPTTRWALIQLLENRGVQMFTQIQYREITNEGLLLVSRTGKEIMVPAETIIIAAGQLPDSSLYELLRNQIEQCYAVGGCKMASETNAHSAIWEASEVARMI